MSKVAPLLVLVFCGCVHHLPTPNEPRAIISKNAGWLQSQCKMLGLFEEVGENSAQAEVLLQIHVRQQGATHLLLTAKRTLNSKRSFKEAWITDSG
jgi:hypothetical protein